MNIWFVYHAPKEWHERNRYFPKEMARAWREAGHKFAILNVDGPTHAKGIRKQDAHCDVAFIDNFRTWDGCKRHGLNLLKRADFRVFITGGGWRRPEWLKSSIRAALDCKADMVCLTHLPHWETFRERIDNLHHVGLGFPPEVFYPDWDRRRDGIVFCGNPAMGRQRRLKLLDGAFPGQVRFTYQLRHARMAEFYRHGLIGWNQMGRGPEEGVSCNLRVWEMIGSGLAMLCGKSAHVPLQDGVHYLSWGSDEEMLEKAGFLLENDGVAEEIGRRAWKESKNHTWRRRALEYKELVEAHT